MALDRLLTSLRSKARSIGLGFSLAASVICGGSCGEAAKESDESPRSCSYDRDCRRDEACIEGSCKTVDVGQYSLDGIVTDWTTGNPADGVKVTIKRDRNTIRDTTDARGHYQLSQLSEGTYTVTWEKGGYLTNKKSVHLLGADKTFDVELAPEEQRLNFSIHIFDKSYSGHTPSKDRIWEKIESDSRRPFLSVDLGSYLPEFIRQHPDYSRFQADGVMLRFEGEATALQVSQNHQVSVQLYETERYQGRDSRRIKGDFAEARIPLEYYRFKVFDFGGGGSGEIFYVKVFDLQEMFRFKCDLNNPTDCCVDWPANEVYRQGMREYCEIEEWDNGGRKWAKCLSDDCHAPFRIDEIDIYLHRGINDDY